MYKLKSPLLRLIFLDRRYALGLFCVAGLASLASLFKTQIALCWGEAIQSGAEGAFDIMLRAVGGMLLFVALDALRTVGVYFLTGRITEGWAMLIRTKLFGRLVYGDMSSLDKLSSSGDLASRLNVDVAGVSDWIGAGLPDLLRRLVMGAVALGVGILLSWQLALVYLTLLPLSIYLINRISKPIQARQAAASKSVGSAANKISEALIGGETIKSYGLQNRFFQSFAETTERTYQENIQIGQSVMKMSTVQQISAIAQTMSLFLLGAWLVTHGQISLGQMMSFMMMSGYIGDAFGTIDRFLSSLRTNITLSGRICAVLDIPEESEGTRPAHPDNDILLDFKEVSFSYPDGTEALSHINLTLRKGEKIGIIGESGSGKSTLIKLITAFYRPTGGVVQAFGEDITTLRNDSLRACLGLVAQEPCLFSGTVSENVQYGRSGASTTEIREAMSQAALSVDELPQGADTRLQEMGRGISGGQGQRLAVARALLRGAELTLLDEASSALDFTTEAELMATLETKLQGKAMLIIAHRLSTVRHCDWIICMKKGRIIEEGSPQKLKEKRGYYYEMGKKQGLWEGVQV